MYCCSTLPQIMVMAALLPMQCFRFAFSSSILSKRRELPLFLAFSSPPRSFSKHRTSSVLLSGRRAILPNTPGASSEGVSSKLVEDPKFVPLNDDSPEFGPPALLLMGFDSTEISKMQNFLKDLDGEFLKIILCTDDMLTQSVWNAVHAEQTDLKAVQVAKSLPRICFLSGLSGEEMMMFIDAFPEIGLKPAVFAALVPNSADKLLKDVAKEVMSDHELLSEKQTS